MLDTLVRLSSALLLTALVPLAILVSRDKLRQHRRGVLIALEDWMYSNAPKKPLPSFEVARIKYELSPCGGAPAAAILERDDIAGRVGPT